MTHPLTSQSRNRVPNVYKTYLGTRPFMQYSEDTVQRLDVYLMSRSWLQCIHAEVGDLVWFIHYRPERVDADAKLAMEAAGHVYCVDGRWVAAEPWLARWEQDRL